MKKLETLLKNLKHRMIYGKSAHTQSVDALAYRSGEVRTGTAFFCLRGEHADGHDFAAEAYARGARIFFCERTLSLPEDCIQVLVEDSRAALAQASAAFFSHPEKRLCLIGVTGTKGKSTVCEMISHVFAKAGKKCISIGTLGIKTEGYEEETENSTPESLVIYRALAKAVELGAEYAVLELSSQALWRHRADGLRFSAAVFTNLSRDHIGNGEHPDFEHYKAAKKALFRAADTAFINADDTFAEEFSRACRGHVYTYGAGNEAHARASSIRPFREGNVFGTRFSCRIGEEKCKVTLGLTGDFSALNALAAVCVCRHFGVPLRACAAALESARVRGRLEPVPCARRDIICIIDYAHNAVSLCKALEALRVYASSRIICVFGSVGGRSECRRKDLASAAARLADVCILTSDNPGFEAPEAIIGEMAAHIPAEKCFCITDRAEAVRKALDMAKSGDIVLFAGKGHEEFQLINGKKLPFSERELIKNHIFNNNRLIPSP